MERKLSLISTLSRLGSITPALIHVFGASEHNLKDLDISIPHGAITVITGLSGSGKSSLAFDTILAEAQRRFFHTLSHYARQFVGMGPRPKVRRVTGLWPAIALRQNETQPSGRATVGSQLDLSELFGVLLARFGRRYCPDHNLMTEPQTLSEIMAHLSSQHTGALLSIAAPLVQGRKGVFATILRKLAAAIPSDVVIDGVVYRSDDLPDLDKDQRHSISVIVDQLRLKAETQGRLQRSLESAMSTSGGQVLVYRHGAGAELLVDAVSAYSVQQGCPRCGYAWSQLEARHFSANAAGRCGGCDGLGAVVPLAEEAGGASWANGRLAASTRQCASCQGTGVAAEWAAIRFQDFSIHDLLKLSVSELLLELAKGSVENPALDRVLSEIHLRLQRLAALGLAYLSLTRRIASLSGGEAQRVRLAGIFQGQLTQILYVLDEPSQGLHPQELEQLCLALERLRDLGNTIIVVDHDAALMQRAALIIDLGPGGGRAGGQVVAQFAPAQASAWVKESRTAAHLVGSLAAPPTSAVAYSEPQAWLEIIAPSLNNLRIPAVKFPRARLSVVSGVSGAGKSSLVLGVLCENLQAALAHSNLGWRSCTEIRGSGDLTKVELLSRAPLARSSTSLPVTYLDILGDLRTFYAALPEAQIAGLGPRAFSLSAIGGRCEACAGRGELILERRFLEDARIPCAHCQGRRFGNAVEAVRYRGLSMGDVLALSLAELAAHFSTHKKLQRRLEAALALGLGYLCCGQPSASLSGGEAQRLKLAALFNQRLDAGSLVLMDEPTTGLHFDDVGRLLAVLRQLCAKGVSIVLIEHDQQMIQGADWQVELGPGAGTFGGQLLWQHRPNSTATAADSRKAP